MLWAVDLEWVWGRNSRGSWVLLKLPFHSTSDSLQWSLLQVLHQLHRRNKKPAQKIHFIHWGSYPSLHHYHGVAHLQWLNVILSEFISTKASAEVYGVQGDWRAWRCQLLRASQFKGIFFVWSRVLPSYLSWRILFVFRKFPDSTEHSWLVRVAWTEVRVVCSDVELALMLLFLRYLLMYLWKLNITSIESLTAHEIPPARPKRFEGRFWKFAFMQFHFFLNSTLKLRV